ncbi:MAG: ABC transporter permease subunit [Deltaproteobacteria bacterium]|nr:ABC transporter permease subunit [Deltaproteobacteria bacterium]
MTGILTIARKELSIYFTTTIGYVAFGAYTFVMGLLFITSVNRFQQYTELYLAQQKPDLLEQLNFNDAIISPMLSTAGWMFLFFVPFLTMRLFAEEKSNRTFELLMTAPITSLDMVLGKFLGASVLVLFMGLLPAIYPLILHIYGVSTGGGSSVEWAPVFSGSLVIVLLGVMFTAIGLFISALTESQVVAALLTFAWLLILCLLPSFSSRLEGDWQTLVEFLGPLVHVARGVRGRIHVADLTYFATFSVVFLVLTHRVVESHRWR